MSESNSHNNNLMVDHFDECGDEKNTFCDAKEHHWHCKYCAKSFSNEYKCRRHFNEAHGSHAVTVGGTTCYPCKVKHNNFGRSERAHYHCPICNGTVLNRQRFLNHMENHETSVKPNSTHVTADATKRNNLGTNAHSSDNEREEEKCDEPIVKKRKLNKK